MVLPSSRGHWVLTWNFIRQPHSLLRTCNSCLSVCFSLTCSLVLTTLLACSLLRPLPEKRDKISSQNNFFFFLERQHTGGAIRIVILIHLQSGDLFLSVAGRFIVLNCRCLFSLACSPGQIEWLTKIYLYDSSIWISALCCLLVQFGVPEIKANRIPTS